MKRESTPSKISGIYIVYNFNERHIILHTFQKQTRSSGDVGTLGQMVVVALSCRVSCIDYVREQEVFNMQSFKACKLIDVVK